MKTALPDHVAAPYYKQLEETIKELFAGPQAELEDLIAKYGHLIDGTDEAQNEKYSGDNFTFEEAVEDIKKARFEISSSIIANTDSAIFSPNRLDLTTPSESSSGMGHEIEKNVT